MSKKNSSLKDEIFNVNSINKLAKYIKAVYHPFADKAFVDDVMLELEQFELKQRVSLITRTLYKYLPKDYLAAIKILQDSLINQDESGSFIFGSHCEYISTYGCSKKDLAISLDTLGEFTKWFTAEFAIREFLNEYPKETFIKMKLWALSSNYHQRRLASEGLRPKLPWAKGINFDYKEGVLPLDNLYYDKERYVTRSVANHLNDISKIDHLLVLEILKKWKKSTKQNKNEMSYIISHSLRTSIKKGQEETLKFLGYNPNPKLKVSNIKIVNNNLSIGETLEFSFNVKALKDENCIIDYLVIYPTPTKRISKKVFKIKKAFLKNNEKIMITKKQTFKLMSTKRLYSGTYKLLIQINGKIFTEEEFHIQT
ncbi:MAG: hypothetical protein QM489_00055 [Candidatus Izemoplasma sp.]